MARQSGRAAASPAPAAGDDGPPHGVLDGRYRLVRRLATDDRWAAVDDLLNRPVEVRFVTVPPEHVGSLVSEAGHDLDGRWLRLLDAGQDSSRTWVAIEDPCRPSLQERVREAPLDPDTAVGFALATARAVADAGPAAGRAVLTPDRVYLDDGGVRLDGLGDGSPSGAALGGETERVREVGYLLQYALTGVWAGPPVAGLTRAPGGPPTGPRRYRGGIPRKVDAVTVSAVRGEIPTLAALIRALDALPRSRRRAGPRPGWILGRRLAWWVIPPVAVAVLGLVAWTLGSDLGAIPGADLVTRQLHSLPPPSPAGPRLVWRQPPGVTSFDPAGDGSEDPAGARLAVDGHPGTAWHTDTYRSPEFSGLKPGVGLLLDLGHRTRVGAGELLVTTPGARVELRAGDRPPANADQLRLVAHGTVRHGTRLTLRLPHPHTDRYWLVWLTRLPPAGSGYSEGIREIRLERPRAR